MMTDEEITEFCARAKGDVFAVVPPIWSDEGLWCFPDGAPDSDGFWYHPLQDDAQAMALVKKFQLHLHPPVPNAARTWWVHTNEWFDGNPAPQAGEASEDLNRSICECVAKAQKQKETQ